MDHGLVHAHALEGNGLVAEVTRHSASTTVRLYTTRGTHSNMNKQRVYQTNAWAVPRMHTTCSFSSCAATFM